MRLLQQEQRPASALEQRILARWSSWGAVPEVFDERRDDWARERETLRNLLDDDAWTEARRTTINAHYTDPAYVSEMWRLVRELGFTEGRVLEPGAGAGTFIGMAPEGATMTGVELDSTTAAIAAALYPHATIRAESFADTRLPAGHFDATIGNVPFANVSLHDPRHNANGHSIHNHFIIKSLALTRPGGLVAVLTSSYTMDAQNPAARREMNGLADLVGAIRLPSGAHRRAAGTEAVTDLLVFRRREAGVAPASIDWETVSARVVDGETVKVNAYFDYRPDHILGDLAYEPGMYGSATMHVKTDRPTADLLPAAIDSVIADARTQRLRMTAAPAGRERDAKPVALAPADLWDGTIVAGPDGFSIVTEGTLQPLKVAKTHAKELRTLLQMRDDARALLTLEAASLDDTTELAQLRAGLRMRYDRYVAVYGPLNRFNTRATGRVDADGEAIIARVTPPAIRAMRDDPFGALTMALEVFDDAEQTARPAGILTHRVVVPRPPVLGAETAAEAVAISLDQVGRVDLELVADLLGVDEDTARAQLVDHVFEDPRTGALIHRPEYLSGDVRVKRDAAIAAAEDRAGVFDANIAALTEVMPTPLTMEEIQPRIGAVWISAAHHEAFLQDILSDSTVRVENPLPGIWEARSKQRHTMRSTSEWGTARRPAVDLFSALLEQKPIAVYDTIKDGGTDRLVFNPVETEAAQEKATALQERFAEWVWEDPERARALTDEYNRRFNSIVLRDYSQAGDHLTLPGLVATFEPRTHQRAAVARMIAEPAVGLFHEVGAGKTAEMVIGVHELKRMSLVNKPVVVVPNHMLEQFSREWAQLYPQDRLLVASSEDTVKQKRRAFVARVATNDWDGVVMTRTAFEAIPLSPGVEARYIERELDVMRAALANVESDDGMSVKRLERAILTREQAQKKLLDTPRDPGVNFEDTGIDYVVVDEAHDFKNLATLSSIPDAAKAGAKRATDLHSKLEYLRSREGARVGTLATATPIANSITEAHVMQRYLRPDLLENTGLTHFDAWAATFGQTVTEMEMAPQGGSAFRQKTRFARFQNVPEMLRMWHVFADVKTAEDLQLPVPLLKRRPDGERLPENVTIAPTSELLGYVTTLGERADAIARRAVSPEEDNMLKVSTDGRKAALDVRLVGMDEPRGFTKIDTVAAKVVSLWEASRDAVFMDPLTGDESPIRGGLQTVFCDLGTPSKNWNAYDELKRKLVERGMPADSIRYIHEARNDTEKARMFAAARSGHIAVLVGSTARMGMGTNVQARMTDLHHVDCPWRPADVQQRDGRGVRQGNMNPEIGIYRYIVERSFDAYMWQAIERKSRFIAQVMRGKLDVREMEDVGEAALSAAETKALASGNPLILEEATIRAEVEKLRRLERAHRRAQANLDFAVTSGNAVVERHARDIAALRIARDRAQPLPDEGTRIEIRGVVHDKRADAGHAIAAWARNSNLQYARNVSRDLGELGEIGGFTILAHLHPSMSVKDPTPHVTLSLRDVPDSGIALPLGEVLDGGIGVVTRLENRVHGIPASISRLERQLEATEAETQQARARLGEPFRHALALEEGEARLAAVAAELRAMADAQNRPAATAGDDVGEKARRAVMLAAADRGAGTLPAGSTATEVRRPLTQPEAERER